MTRYIDADKAIQQIRKQSSRSVARECAVNAVNNTPAEDVAPVIHAQWKDIKYLDRLDGFFGECGNCGMLGEVALYCMHCGARMDDRTGQIERIDNT